MNEFEKRHLNAFETLIELIIGSIITSFLLAGESVLLSLCVNIKELKAILILVIIFTILIMIVYFVGVIKNYFNNKVVDNKEVVNNKEDVK